MEKRMLLALVSSVLIIVVWTMIFPPAGENPAVPINGEKKEIVDVVTPRESPNLEAENETLKHKIAIDEKMSGQAEVKEYVLENDLIKLVFSNKGAIVKKIVLKKYVDENKEKISLLDLEKEKNTFFPFGLTFDESGSSIGGNLNKVVWDENKAITNESILSFSFILFEDEKPKLKIVKEFALENNSYLIRTKIKIENLDANSQNLASHNIFWEPVLKVQKTDNAESTIATYLSNQIEHEEVSKIEEEKIYPLSKDKVNENFWISSANKYFIVTLLPGKNVKELFADKKEDQYKIGMKIEKQIIEPGEIIVESNDVYVGPKEYDRLKSIGKSMEENIDFGFFGLLSKWLLISLRYLNTLVDNYGTAIIIITIILKILFMPLTEKSFVSMKEMHKIQPELDALKEKYKNDQQRLNAEIMKLYKDRGANPLAGCLPMIAQIPIFWAFFNTLRAAIELRQAPFIWWINDLSMPDTIFSIGSIPINILPILMLLSMIVQQKMTTQKNPNATKEQQTQQKMLLLGMPVVFGFMFYNMPSGLVLYWFLSNVLSIIHQYYINKKLALQS